MKKLGFFVTFYMNLHTRSRSQVKKFRLQQNVAAPPALAPQHCLLYMRPTFLKLTEVNIKVPLQAIFSSDFL
jgi:hypothetical protein